MWVVEKSNWTGTAAGVDIAEVLGRFGATDVGTRADVIGDEGKRRGFMCAVGDPTAKHLPVVARFLTRVLPLGRAAAGVVGER